MTDNVSTPDERPQDTGRGLSRRGLLGAAGAGAAALAVAPLLGGGGTAAAATAAALFPDLTGATTDPVVPPVTGLHLQFGADAASQAVISWHTLGPVTRPRVRLGRPDTGITGDLPAETVSYTDAKSGQAVYAHHARVTGLPADSAIGYGAVHDGAAPQCGSFRTAPGAAAPSRSRASATRGPRRSGGPIRRRPASSSPTRRR
ncbi:MAG: hypothetical protein JWM48_3387 [Mycobacterium sp.]|nr:hypothetical protein [Mycobacterium sp.]